MTKPANNDTVSELLTALTKLCDAVAPTQATPKVFIAYQDARTAISRVEAALENTKRKS